MKGNSVKKIVKALASLIFSAVTAVVVGASYEHGRKIGRGEVKLGPEAMGSTANGMMTKLVTRFVLYRAKAVAEQEAKKAKRPGVRDL